MKKLNSKIVLVKVDAVKETNADGLYEAEEWKTQPATGVVLAVANDVTFCNPGDKVFIVRYAVYDTPFGDDVKAILEESVLVVYDED